MRISIYTNNRGKPTVTVQSENKSPELVAQAFKKVLKELAKKEEKQCRH